MWDGPPDSWHEARRRYVRVSLAAWAVTVGVTAIAGYLSGGVGAAVAAAALAAGALAISLVVFYQIGRRQWNSRARGL